ncbi:MAG: type II toxin-antitoxin system VapC family toxin [Symploca sp. SIO1B1]|nr:type II toxin-antitoxin system VapC family toxin [Symploca sp. SIO1B1]
MYILDTDHLSLIQRNGQEGRRIISRLEILEKEEVAVTIITYEEQIRGRLSVISRAKSLDEQLLAYQWLQQLLDNYRSIAIIPFNRTAGLEYRKVSLKI